MANDISVQVIGVEQVLKKMLELPSIIVLRAFDRALGAAGAVIEQEIIARAPEDEEGLLKDSTVLDISIDPAGRGGTCSIGYRHGDLQERTGVPADVLADWIEFGHWHTTHAPKKRPIRFVPGTRFMGQATEAAYERAVERFGNVLVDMLDSSILSETGGEVDLIAKSTAQTVSVQDYLEGIHEF